MTEFRQIDMDIILQSKLDYNLASDKTKPAKLHCWYYSYSEDLRVESGSNFNDTFFLSSWLMDPGLVRTANDVICIQRKHKTLIKIVQAQNLLALANQHPHKIRPFIQTKPWDSITFELTYKSLILLPYLDSRAAFIKLSSGEKARLSISSLSWKHSSW